MPSQVATSRTVNKVSAGLSIANTSGSVPGYRLQAVQPQVLARAADYATVSQLKPVGQKPQLFCLEHLCQHHLPHRQQVLIVIKNLTNTLHRKLLETNRLKTKNAPDHTFFPV
jgi:hypothetical protein